MHPLPNQPDGVPWPTDEWPTAPLPDRVDADRLAQMLDNAFSPESGETQGQTNAVVVVHRGSIVAERYAEGMDAGTTLPSWSMAKSILHGLVGVLVRDGRLDLEAPTPITEWSDPDDRHDITLDVLLRMSSGLRWAEDYVDDRKSDVIAMLYGDGQDDMAAYAASQPLDHAPDTEWNYSSGDSVIVSKIAGLAIGGDRTDYEHYLHAQLFEPLGMRRAAPKFDNAGTWVGSSFCYDTARDFARFGLLYLRDGVWEGERFLPDGWADYARRLTHTCTTFDYGAHWWLIPDNRYGIFYASGYEGQYTMVVPDLDLIVVRLGQTVAEKRPSVLWFLNRLIRLFAQT
jgi:CubicO group peptidase (beta-lactamase class C family)